MTSIGEGAFYGTAWYNNQPDGMVYAGKVAYEYKGTMPAGTHITIREGTIGISGYAFYGCSGLTSIIIPNSVTSIGDYAFDECSSLTSVTISNSVTSIGEFTFNGCCGLISVTIPNSVTSIGRFAFAGCSNLSSISIPNSVTRIGEYAFSSTPWYNNQPNGLVYAGKVVYKYKGTMPIHITIKEGTLGIADWAFKECSRLTSITIPNSVTRIGESAFFESSLTSITIPNSVTSIGDYAFSSCSLTSVTIPNSITSIGDYTFSSCWSLTSVTIPNSVTSIGKSAFKECSSLTFVTIPNSVTSIGNYAFAYCRGLTSVTIGNSVTSIGNHAFDGCSGLTSVTIPNSVTSIGNWAFCACTSMTSVAIPISVTSFGGGIFMYCSGLTDVWCYIENVPSLDTDAFYKSSFRSATLHVPAASVVAYCASNPWGEFGTIVALPDEDAIIEVKALPVLIQTQGGIITIQGVAEGTPIIVYDLDGRQYGTTVSEKDCTTIATSLRPGTTAVVKIGERSVKVLMK